MAELVVALALAAAQHSAELLQLYSTAKAEGRDVTPEELAVVRAKAVTAIDTLEAQHRP